MFDFSCMKLVGVVLRMRKYESADPNKTEQGSDMSAADKQPLIGGEPSAPPPYAPPENPHGERKPCRSRLQSEFFLLYQVTRLPLQEELPTRHLRLLRLPTVTPRHQLAMELLLTLPYDLTVVKYPVNLQFPRVQVVQAAPIVTRRTVIEPKPPNHILLSLIVFLMFCWVFGLIALIMGMQVSLSISVINTRVTPLFPG